MVASGVFISYRGEDSQSYGALIYSELSRRFGEDQVFLDSESTQAGDDFVDVMFTRLRKCSVLLAVIGRDWLTVTDAAGRRRIDSSKDWIRRELVEAFTHGLRVIPILTNGVEIPSMMDLPTDIAALRRCQYRRIYYRSAGSDLARIVDELTTLHPELAEAARQQQVCAGREPRQLPAAPRLFTGRAQELAQLTEELEATGSPGATMVISAIGGAGGIGKTALALQWAHQNIKRFPDGQLYVNLRGFDPFGPPMPSAVAVRGFLDALGTEPRGIPVDLDAQSALYRSVAVGRRMLILLDNARDTAHLTPLLPGSATCTVLVTSRRQLAGLVTEHGARPLTLDVLSEAEARELFVRSLDPGRIAAEPDAAAELLACCAGLPLAVRIVAARAATHPSFPLAALAEELREESVRLDALDAGELEVNLRAVFSCSYRALDTDAVAVLKMLSLAPGPDIGLLAAASLTADPATRARMLLRSLEAAHLVQQHNVDRYRLHDLVRLYVVEQARRDQLQDNHDTALRRLVDFYLHSAYSGDRLLYSHHAPIDVGHPATGCVPHTLEDEAATMAWFDTEHPCLLAAQQLAAEKGWHTPVWQLAWALHTFHWRRGHLHDNIATWRSGLTSAQRLGDPAAIALAHRFLGYAYSRAGRHVDGLNHLHQALVLTEQTGDIYEQAHTHHVLAQAWELRGDDQQALTHATDALCLFKILNNPVWEAHALNAVGWYQAHLGHYQQGRTSCEVALTLLRRRHDREGEAGTLDSLGYIAHHTGQYSHAIGYYNEALTLFRDLGHAYEEANTLERLGEAHAALGHHTDAHNSWQHALDLYHAQHRTTDVHRICQQMAVLDHS